MRRIIITAFAWMTMAFCHAQTTGALLKVERNVMDFGAIEYDSEVEDSLTFYNEGSDTLIIYSAYADCGCTVPSYSRAPVAPGDSGHIAVRFNSRGRAPGSFRKVIRIRSNSVHPTKVLFVTGRIKRPYRK